MTELNEDENGRCYYCDKIHKGKECPEKEYYTNNQEEHDQYQYNY